MQFSVYEIMNKVEFMHRMIDRIDDNVSLDDYANEIRDILEEYSDILKCTKVNV